MNLGSNTIPLQETFN